MSATQPAAVEASLLLHWYDLISVGVHAPLLLLLPLLRSLLLLLQRLLHHLLQVLRPLLLVHLQQRLCTHSRQLLRCVTTARSILCSIKTEYRHTIFNWASLLKVPAV
jgi:hypothetical protein